MWNNYFDFNIDSEPEQNNHDELNVLGQALHGLLNPRQQQQPRQNPNNNNPNLEYFKTPLATQYNPAYKEPDSYNRPGSGLSLMDILRQRESGGNYKTRNSLGYSGGYQFGAPALEAVGLLKPGASKHGNKGLTNPANWTIEGGLEAFLNNPSIQDKAMQKFMESNKQTLTRMGLINEETPQNVINAMLSAAHLGGPGGVKKLMSGTNRKDAYGASVQDYYNMGLKAGV